MKASFGKLVWYVAFLLLFIHFVLTAKQCEANEQIERAGDIVQIGLPVFAATMTYLENDLDGTKQFLKSEVAMLAVTHSVKRIVNAPRPNGSDYSFPSGHTAQAFQSAHFLSKRYGDKYGLKLKIPVYALATFVGWSRCEAEQHFYTDVAAGALVGILAAEFFTDKITPIVSRDTVGLVVNFRF